MKYNINIKYPDGKFNKKIVAPRREDVDIWIDKQCKQKNIDLTNKKVVVKIEEIKEVVTPTAA